MKKQQMQERIDFIKQNYQNMTLSELMDALGVCQSTAYRLIERAGVRQMMVHGNIKLESSINRAKKYNERKTNLNPQSPLLPDA